MRDSHVTKDGTFHYSANGSGQVLFEEGATQGQRDEARAILEALDTAYPGHPWAVRVYGDGKGGGFFIRHLDFPSNYGMNCHHKGGAHYSTSAMKRDVIMKAGEWLERAGLSRTAFHDEPIKRLEGIPDRFQPPSAKPPVEAVLIDAYGNPIRSEVRPQVTRMV